MAKETKNTPVTELFKQFCKERHAEDKGRNYDMLQEVYSKTELFDLSFLSRDKKVTPESLTRSLDIRDNDYTLVADVNFLENVSIPFESQFIKVAPSTCIYLHEFSPNIITGTIQYHSDWYQLNMTFDLQIERKRLVIDLHPLYDLARTFMIKGMNKQMTDSNVNQVLNFTYLNIYYTLTTICNLPKYSVASDTPKHAEYYTRKHSSTIKVVKPIYYVMDKKEETEKRNYNRIKPLGHLAFDHSFKVRGHWRKINPHTYGKNRQGEYVVTGITWVKEHIRGEGDLVKKIRVLK